MGKDWVWWGGILKPGNWGGGDLAIGGRRGGGRVGNVGAVQGYKMEIRSWCLQIVEGGEANTSTRHVCLKIFGKTQLKIAKFESALTFPFFIIVNHIQPVSVYKRLLNFIQSGISTAGQNSTETLCTMRRILTGCRQVPIVDCRYWSTIHHSWIPTSTQARRTPPQ